MRVEKKLRQDMQHSVKVTSKSLFKLTDTEFFVGIVITVKYHLNSYTCPSVKHCLNNKSVFSLKAEESLHSTRC